ncbi:hypothetical protein CI610_03725 [invertebrate metagenome]|uniref:Integrase core domain-containing protein n=1 Tax=invertebrate metagenome TaxID=1711999 RepID=A0A2H9T2B4_9ZZZZ
MSPIRFRIFEIVLWSFCILQIVLVLSIFLVVAVNGADDPDIFINDDSNLDEMVTFYFNDGYTYYEILGFLLIHHDVVLSLRQLKRILRRQRLRRSNAGAPARDVIRGIRRLRDAGLIDVGYRTVWKLLNTRCGLRVTQFMIRHALRLIDNEGVNNRRSHRLRRRLYYNKGPNFLMHIDGFDKLKPYSIAIHGSIDGFSRRIVWLKAGFTNNNPRYVARFYIDEVLRTMTVPRCIRSDNGTENVIIEDLHKTLRSRHPDAVAGQPVFLKGRSTANQRIEMFWGFLNRHVIQFWKSLFKDLRDSGILQDTYPIHIECVIFCFIGAIQRQLDEFRYIWNRHRIRQQHLSDCYCGILNVLYFQPELFGTSNYSLPVPFEQQDVERVADIYTVPFPKFDCNDDFLQIVELLSDTNRDELVQPRTANEAIRMFTA